MSKLLKISVFFLGVLICSAHSAAQNKSSFTKKISNFSPSLIFNEGQFCQNVKFISTGDGSAVLLSKNKLTVLFAKYDNDSENFYTHKDVPGIRKSLVNSENNEFFLIDFDLFNDEKNIEIRGENRLPFNCNFFKGNDPSKWQKNVPNYSRIRISGIYEKIDLIFECKDGLLKYYFEVAPGGNPYEILFGLNVLKKTRNGLAKSNITDYLTGEIIKNKPGCYQIVDEKRIRIRSGLKISENSDGKYKFTISDFNGEYPLFIEPDIVFSTFLGNGGTDVIMDIKVDDNENIYVIGYTNSFHFPTSGGAYDESFNANNDFFVSKFNKTGETLLYSTYIGGSLSDIGYGIAIDHNGTAYLTGYTESANYPVTDNAINDSYSGNIDAVLTVLSAEGNDLIFSSYIGGAGMDYAYQIASDLSGNACIVGGTNSADFETTPGAFREEINYGTTDGFVCKINVYEGSFLYSTLLGGRFEDDVTEIVVDDFGYAYLGGYTMSDDFPVSENAPDKEGAGEDGFVCKLNPSGSSLIYSTYIGGTEREFLNGIDVDNKGQLYITGQTRSNDYPVTEGAFDSSFNGPRYDAFVTKLNASGDSLIYSTYIGGTKYDVPYGIAVNERGNVFITGYATSSDYPMTKNAYDTTFNGETDVIFSVLNTTGSDLIYSTFIGGYAWDKGHRITVSKDERVYIAGKTNSSDFPSTAGVYDDTFNGGTEDCFIFVFDFGKILDVRENVLFGDLKGFELHQNYPNPFNCSTKITFDLKIPEYVSLKIYNITGQLIKNLVSGYFSNGTHIIPWDGKNDAGNSVGSGMYIYKINTAGYCYSKKMILLR